MTIPEIQEKVRKIQADLDTGIKDLMSSEITVKIIKLDQERFKKLQIELRKISTISKNLREHFEGILCIK